MPRPKKNPDASAQEGEQAGLTTGKASAPAFVFIGDKTGHGPEELKLFGLIFKKNGAAVEVDNAAVAKRLAGNSHFKAV